MPLAQNNTNTPRTTLRESEAGRQFTRRVAEAAYLDCTTVDGIECSCLLRVFFSDPAPHAGG